MIPLEIGQKVIFYNGETGRIVNYDAEAEAITVKYDYPFAKIKSGEVIYLKQPEINKFFYLLGKNLYKNKCSEEDIDKLKSELEYHRNMCECLRKQLFNLNERMVDDWRERQGKKDV